MITYKRISEIEEPLLTLDEGIKEQYLRVDFDFEDDLINSLLTSVVLQLEKELRMPLFKADYNIVFDLTGIYEYDYGKIDPYYDFRNVKVNAIDSMSELSIFGVSADLEETTDYLYNENTNRLYFPSKKNLPGVNRDHLLLTANLGFTKNNLPQDITTALYGLVAYYYQNRGVNVPMPLEIINAVASYKRWF